MLIGSGVYIHLAWIRAPDLPQAPRFQRHSFSNLSQGETPSSHNLENYSYNLLLHMEVTDHTLGAATETVRLLRMRGGGEVHELRAGPRYGVGGLCYHVPVHSGRGVIRIRMFKSPCYRNDLE